MRAVLESVGVKDVLAKSKGSSNPHNLVKATILALSQMRDAYTVAGARGISMERGFNGLLIDQKRTLQSLGLRKISQVVEREDSPEVRGMIRKVHHLVTVVE